MKLQADSNYLLSKEYEVRLRLRDASAVLVATRISLPISPVESQADRAQESGWRAGSILCGMSHLVSEASLISTIAQPTKYYLDKMLRKNEQISNVNLILSVI